MKYSKFIVTGLAAVLIASPMSMTASSVYASEVGTVETVNAPKTTNKSPEEISRYIAEIGIDVNNSEIAITDSQMMKLFDFLGYDLEIEPTRARAAGVTKVVSRGSGSWDIYLSRGFVKAYYYGGFVLGTGLTVAITALVPGLGWTVASSMVTALAGVIGSEANHGVVFRIRNWKISSTGRQ